MTYMKMKNKNIIKIEWMTKWKKERKKEEEEDWDGWMVMDGVNQAPKSQKTESMVAIKLSHITVYCIAVI